MSALPPPPPTTDNQPTLTDEEKERAEQWKKFESELKRAQDALQKPMVDTFIRSDNPERELTVMNLKTLDL